MENEIVQGTVTRIEEYGIYLDTPKGSVLVLITEIQDEPIQDLRVLFSKGDTIPLRILHYVKDFNVHKGTLKNL